MDEINHTIFFIVIAAVAAELAWSFVGTKSAYNLKEVLCNLGIMLGNRLIRPISLAWKYLAFKAVEPYMLFELPLTIPSLLVTFIVAELGYYWYHRFSHEIPLLWTMHHTHHSSRWYNLTTAIRLNWIANFFSPLFFIPFVLIGFSPEWLTLFLAVGLFYQFFLHTEAVGKLGFLEGLFLNTPSAHRVHHGSNPIYIDKNYGAMLIVFDRLFGTYQRETEPVNYGVTTGDLGHNPIRVQLAPLWKFLRGNLRREKDNVESNQSA